MAAVYGKKVTKVAIQPLFENDELQESSGVHINAHFSKYDQWQRTDRTTKTPISMEKCSETKMTFKVGTPQRTKSPHRVTRLATGGPRTLAKLEDERRKKKEVIDLLELRIKHGKQTTDLYNKRAQELMEMNLDIIREIENQEHETYAEVKKLLRKYEKFRGSIVALNSHFAKEISQVKRELEESKESIQKQLKALEQNVQEMDRELKIKQEEIQFLRCYKDKEYPLKELMISKLHTELDSTRNSNQEEQEDLELIIKTELGKYDKQKIHLMNDVTCRAAEEFVAAIHPSLTNMELQNMLMKKEIELHKTEQASLTESNKKLKKEVTELAKHPKSNVRFQLFPELFPAREKCDPDAEIVLNIPRQEWLTL